MTERSKVFITTEDGIACLLAFVIIGANLLIPAIPVPAYSWKFAEVAKIFSSINVTVLLIYSIFFISIIACSTRIIKGTWKGAWKTALLIVSIGQFALLIAGNQSIKSLNLEAIIFSLLIGLVINYVFRLPEAWRNALQSELLIKTGLVLLGASVIFSDILKAGAFGLIQALFVVIAVWYFAFWLCRRFKLDEELNLMLSSAVSICGVSAAIATAGAIKGDEKKLSFVISLVLITALPMIVLMPYLADLLHLSPAVTGAWLGGTIDTTGAVVAAGSIAGEGALKYSTIVKFSQNVLLGLAAFGISIYWTYRKQGSVHEKPSAALIWQRFPKFVLGFIIASILFSFLLPSGTVTTVKDCLKNTQTAFFVIAFSAIGLEMKVSDLFSKVNHKPLMAFLLAQFFNILFTLIIAYLLFKDVI